MREAIKNPEMLPPPFIQLCWPEAQPFGFVHNGKFFPQSSDFTLTVSKMSGIVHATSADETDEDETKRSLSNGRR